MLQAGAPAVEAAAHAQRLRPVRADDYEPWLADRIRRGEIDPPDEFVIEEP